MNCTDCRDLIEAYTDGELDLVKHTELEKHLGLCPACAAAARNSLARRTALTGATRHKAPDALRSSVRAALLASGMPRESRAPARPSSSPSFWIYAGIAASLALALTAGFRLGEVRGRAASLGREAVANHLRSLQAEHLMDVVSTDQHTVKPWFAGKLDFSPPVADLADVGFPLAGGRLERIAGHPAAALVFRRKLHVINVYVWPEADGAVPPGESRIDGFGVVGWSSGGLNFAAVSEIPIEDLQTFVASYRKRTLTAAPD